MVVVKLNAPMKIGRTYFSSGFTNSTAIDSPLNGEPASVEPRKVTTTDFAGLILPQLIEAL
jgi:hypothetical protein